ncbi:MAG: hypothetical protein K2N38_02560 [Oscillospiraceae bacterium]|nr:hypothetical protein [Oscillospiraceae bacterium]
MSENHPTPEWAKLLPEGEFISYLPSYVGGKYFDLFDKFTFPCEETGAITYYVYDPVKQGADPSGKYPVLLWLHGATNGLNGTFCICNCGGELFASPEYQAAMGGNTDVAAVAPKAQQDVAQPRATGGAYIVVPLANEKMDDNGKLAETFSEKYFEPLKGIVERVREGGGTDAAAVAPKAQQDAAQPRATGGNAGKVFAMGGSLGGWMTWKMAEEFPEMFGGIIPISTSYIPTDEQLENIARHRIAVYFTLGRHDETLDFDKDIAPRIPKMEELGFTCFFPEWVKNGDGGVASLFYGWEMGQHCMINQVQANLMYDDGTPYDPRLPNGVCGWIKAVVDCK